ncbi:MAG: RNA-binding domain-containing protein [Candidatus Nitrosocosmicus sp.]
MHSSVEISILIHATENENNVLNSIFNLMDFTREPTQVKSIKTEGHWKNPIIRLIISVNDDVDRIFEKLYALLVEAYGENYVNDYINTNTDGKGYIYIRLDKQNICKGNVVLSDRDAIRMVFKKLGKFESRSKT